MPEDELETQDLKERLEEAAEAGGERGAEVRWTTWLSLSTAIIAVLAAIAALESGAYSNDAIVQKNDAVLHQSKAGDAWSHYQAAGVKATIYSTQAVAAPRPDLADRWAREAERERSEQKTIKEEAEIEQEKVDEMGEKSEHSLHVHHQFAKSVTVFQVAIALAAIAALTRRKGMWWVSLAVGAAGVGLFALGVLAS